MKGLSTRDIKEPNTELGAHLRGQQRRKDPHDNKQARKGREHKGKILKLRDRRHSHSSVKSGTPQYIKKKVRVVIIRQKSPIRRANGMRVRFEDNAGILVTDTNLAVGTEVKGAMAREIVERYVKLAGIASRVV